MVYKVEYRMEVFHGGLVSASRHHDDWYALDYEWDINLKNLIDGLLKKYGSKNKNKK